MMRPSLAVLLIALTSAVALGAVSASHWERVPAKDHARPNPLAGQPAATAAGAFVYSEHCQQCHQANAQGDGHKRPSLRSERIRSATDGDIEWFLRQGDLRNGMPSWSSLPQAQRWQLVTYLRSIQ
ncbi:MAG: cytochrome c [Terracidiphilus sp.]|jgi:mono/diheme cytochrome c family protein